MAKPRKIRANLFLFLTVLLLGLVLIEICLRIFSPLPVGYPRGTFKVDSELGYAFTEDFSSEIIEPEFKTKINTNSFSFRDSELSLEQLGQNDLVILGLGDSFTFGYGVEENETFLSILENDLNKQGIETEIINAGVGGYGLIQERILAQRLAPLFNPDIVLLNFDLGNDLADDYNFRENRQWRSANGYLVKVTDSWLVNAVKVSFNRLQLAGHLRNIAIKANNYLKNKSYPNNRQKELPMDVKQYSVDYDGEMDAIWLRTEIELKNLHNYLTNNNIILIIMAVPYKIQVNQTIQELAASSYGLELAEFDFKKINKLLSEFSQENNIILIDPVKSFEKDANKYYFIKDGHWNKYGHQLAAEIIYHQLRDTVEGQSD